MKGKLGIAVGLAAGYVPVSYTQMTLPKNSRV
jgi:hypothetical protein